MTSGKSLQISSEQALQKDNFALPPPPHLIPQLNATFTQRMANNQWQCQQITNNDRLPTAMQRLLSVLCMPTVHRTGLPPPSAASLGCEPQ